MLKVALAMLCVLLLAAHGIHVVPVADVDLDSPPEERWIPALRAVITNYTYDYSFKLVFNAKKWVFSQLPEGAQ